MPCANDCSAWTETVGMYYCYYRHYFEFKSNGKSLYSKNYTI